MIKDSLEYCKIVCNYLNNLKGNIEDYEIINLMWCVFGASEEDLDTNKITNEDILRLSSDVECDKGSTFYEDLYTLYNKIKRF